MMINELFIKAAEAVRKSESVLIFGHVNPDGDAVGSSAAIGLTLKQMNKKVDYAVFGESKRLSSLINESKLFCCGFEKEYDLALIIDSSTFEYIKNNEFVSRCKTKLVIDHHITNPAYGDINIIVPEAAACAEVVFDFINVLKGTVTPEIAEALFIGIWEDTGGFAFTNTTANTHLVVSKLYDYSDNLNEIIARLKTYPSERLYLIRTALNGLKVFEQGKIAAMLLTYENGYDKIKDVDTTELIDLVRYVDGCELAVMVKQTSADSEFKVSVRSNTEELDIYPLAVSFGGGGHKKAAGFTYKGETDELLNVIRDYYRQT